MMRICGIILDNNTNRFFEDDVQIINKKIDSTNSLLRNVLMVLWRFSKKLNNH